MVRFPWWQEAVTYEIYVRSFGDASGDGVGDLEGVRRRLDYLDWLGVDAIWLTPFYRSPMADFGYDIEDHTDVDPLFGDLAAFDRLVADAHRRDIRVIVDFVPNHTSERHPWFEESRASRTNHRRDWYFWREPRDDHALPNNWLSLFGGPAWQLDPATGEYYLHTFLREQPDLNWRNPEVESAMHDVVRFWLDRGVDGFRIDVAGAIAKDPLLRDNPLNPQPTAGGFGRHWLSQVHVHDFAHPDVYRMYRDFRRILDAAGPPDRISIAEVSSHDLPKWAAYYGDNLDAIHMPFGFHLIRADWQADRLVETVRRVEEVLPSGAWPNWVLGNHDQPRIASWVGPERARIAMLLLLTLRGTPTLYYGDEIGMTDVPIPPDAIRDPWERNEPGQGRDPERTPMRWTAEPNAGFCPPGAEPWLPIGDRRPGDDVASQRADSCSILSFTRALIAYRRASEALLRGDWAPIEAPPSVVAFTRTATADRVAVALNLAPDEAVVTLPAAGSVRLSTAGVGDREGERTSDGGAVRLRAYEGLVVQLS
ncbi:MAG TPA: alpha-amylase family glycosyl hydrolase [Candidatus Limnocylindrales bacterium]|nr:alpha-amylase family glycosyl hydrolase [Candidatus Limnocylindrales bacterium]